MRIGLPLVCLCLLTSAPLPGRAEEPHASAGRCQSAHFFTVAPTPDQAQTISAWAEAAVEDLYAVLPTLPHRKTEKPILILCKAGKLRAPQVIRLHDEVIYNSRPAWVDPKGDRIWIEPERDPYRVPYLAYSVRRCVARLQLMGALGADAKQRMKLPAWLVEGVSAHVAGRGSLALEKVNRRLMGLQLIQQFEARRLLPLNRLLSLDQAALLRKHYLQQSEWVAQSWGFVVFLCEGTQKTRAQSLQAYVRALASTRGDVASGLRRFGDAATEAAWRRHVETLQGAHHDAPLVAPFADVAASRRPRCVRSFLAALVEKSEAAQERALQEAFGNGALPLRGAVRQALGCRDSGVRVLASRAASLLRDRAALKRLTDMALRDKSAPVRTAAAQAAARLNCGCAPTAFYDALSSSKDARRLNAIRALGAAGDPQALGALLEVVYTVTHRIVTGGTNGYQQIGTHSNYVSNWTQQGTVFQPEVESLDQEVMWQARVIKLDIWEYRVTAIHALKQLAPQAAGNDLKAWLRWRKALLRGETPTVE